MRLSVEWEHERHHLHTEIPECNCDIGSPPRRSYYSCSAYDSSIISFSPLSSTRGTKMDRNVNRQDTYVCKNVREIRCVEWLRRNAENVASSKLDRWYLREVTAFSPLACPFLLLRAENNGTPLPWLFQKPQNATIRLNAPITWIVTDRNGLLNPLQFQFRLHNFSCYRAINRRDRCALPTVRFTCPG